MAIWQASRPTVINSKIWGRCSWREGSGFSIFERVKNLINASGAIRALPFHFFFFFRTAHESLKFCFCSRLPFWVFTLEPHFSFFFYFFIFWLSYCALENSKFIPKRVNVLSRWFWLKNKDNSLVDYENSLRKNASV